MLALVETDIFWDLHMPYLDKPTENTDFYECEYIVWGVIDCWLSLANKDKKTAKYVLHKWMCHNASIFNRISLYLIHQMDILSINEKINFLNTLYKQEFLPSREINLLLEIFKKSSLTDKQWVKLEHIILKRLDPIYPYYTSEKCGFYLNITKPDNKEFSKDALKCVNEYKNRYPEHNVQISYKRPSVTAKFISRYEDVELFPKSLDDILCILNKSKIEEFRYDYYIGENKSHPKIRWQASINAFKTSQVIDILNNLKKTRYYLPLTAIFLQQYANNDKIDAKNIDNIINLLPEISAIKNSVFIYEIASFLEKITFDFGKYKLAKEYALGLYKNTTNDHKNTSETDYTITAISSSIGLFVRIVNEYLYEYNKDKTSEELHIPDDIKNMYYNILKNPNQSNAWSMIGMGLGNLAFYDNEWVQKQLTPLINDVECVKSITMGIIYSGAAHTNLANLIFPIFMEYSKDILKIDNELKSICNWINRGVAYYFYGANIQIPSNDLTRIYTDIFDKKCIEYTLRFLKHNIREKESKQRQEFIDKVAVNIWEYIPKDTDFTDANYNMMEYLYICCMLDNTENKELFNKMKTYLGELKEYCRIDYALKYIDPENYQTALKIMHLMLKKNTIYLPKYVNKNIEKYLGKYEHIRKDPEYQRLLERLPNN